MSSLEIIPPYSKALFSSSWSVNTCSAFDCSKRRRLRSLPNLPMSCSETKSSQKKKKRIDLVCCGNNGHKKFYFKNKILFGVDV